MRFQWCWKISTVKLSANHKWMTHTLFNIPMRRHYILTGDILNSYGFIVFPFFREPFSNVRMSLLLCLFYKIISNLWVLDCCLNCLFTLPFNALKSVNHKHEHVQHKLCRFTDVQLPKQQDKFGVFHRRRRKTHYKLYGFWLTKEWVYCSFRCCTSCVFTFDKSGCQGAGVCIFQGLF